MDFFREGSKKEILDEIVKPGRKKDSWPNLLSYDKNKKKPAPKAGKKHWRKENWRGQNQPKLNHSSWGLSVTHLTDAMAFVQMCFTLPLKNMAVYILLPDV